MDKNELTNKLTALLSKQDRRDQFNAENLHTLAEAALILLEEGGGAGIADVPMEVETIEPNETPEAVMRGETLVFRIPQGEEGPEGPQGAEGKSAYQVWLEDNGWTAEQHPVSEYLNSLKAHVSAFVPVAYNETAAGISIGQTYDFELQSPIDGSMVIMPNAGSDATGSIMYAVSVNEGVATYTRVGDVAIDVSDFLDSSNVDGTELKNPTTTQVAKASDVMKLAAKLEGVTAVEDKVTPTTTGTAGTYIKPDNTTGSGTGWQWGEFALGNAKAVRFVALDYKTSTTPSSGWLFLDDSDNILKSALYTHTAQATTTMELVVAVPEGATTFKTNIAGSELTGKFYCYLQSGENVEDMINAVQSSIERKIEGTKEEVEGEEVITSQAINDSVLFGQVQGWFRNLIYTGTDFYAYGKNSNSNLRAIVTRKGEFSKLKKEGATKIKITAGSKECYVTFLKTDNYPTEGTLFSTLRNEYLSTVHNDNAVIEIGANSTEIIDIPRDATKLWFTKSAYQFKSMSSGTITKDSIQTNRLPVSVKFIYERTVEEGLKDEINKRFEEIDNTSIKSNVPMLGLTKGDVKEDGSIDGTAGCFLTGYIPYTGFVLELHDPYRISWGYLFDKNHNLINYYERSQYLTRDFGFAGEFPQFYVRYKIVKIKIVDGVETVDEDAEYDVQDDVIKTFCFLNDQKLHRYIPTYTDVITKEVWKNFHARVKQMINPVWKCFNTIDSKTNTFISGSVNRGLPYTECGEYSKFVGFHVSLYTYITALLNPRSVIYTEIINYVNRKSKYGLIDYYHGITNASPTTGVKYAFYGSVCTGLTSFVVGLNQVVASSRMNEVIPNSYSGTCVLRGIVENGENKWQKKIGNEWETVEKEEIFESMLPMDLILYQGHCSVCSDVYLSEDEDVEIVVWTEQIGPRGTMTPYRKESFLSRLEGKFNDSTIPGSSNSKWQVWRFSSFNGLKGQYGRSLYPDVDGDLSFINMNGIGEFTPNRLSIDPDITTFAGEKPVFVINKDVRVDNDNIITDGSEDYNIYGGILNVHRDEFTRLIIEKSQDGVSYDTIKILDITSNDNVIIKQSNILPEDTNEDWVTIDIGALNLEEGYYRAKLDDGTNATKTSGYTYWLMVGISLSYNSETHVATFNVMNGSPYLIRSEELAGATGGNHVEIDNNETAGQVSINNGSNQYIKIFVKTEYGVGVKRIKVS